MYPELKASTSLFLRYIIIYAYPPQQNIEVLHIYQNTRMLLISSSAYTHMNIHRFYLDTRLSKSSAQPFLYRTQSIIKDSNQVFPFTVGEVACVGGRIDWQLCGSSETVCLWLCCVGNKNIWLYIVGLHRHKEIVKGMMSWSNEIILRTVKSAVIFILWECERFTFHTRMPSPPLWQVHGYSGMHL